MRYRFGDCVFDDARGELRRLDDIIALEPQVLAVLHYLLVHRQRVVSRDELLEQCWPQTYVSDAALTSCLRRVRQAIGQTQGGPTLIETLHRRGYRFVAEVIAVDESAALPPAEPVSPEMPPSQREPPPAPVAPATPHDADAPSGPTLPSPSSAAPIEVTVLAERRHLTVLSCTLAGADALSLPLDPEVHYELMQTFYATAQAIVAPYAGQVVRQLDHGVVVYFGYPQAHEDDAHRAVRSGLALVEAVRHGALSAFEVAGLALDVRVGIATGTMIVRAGGDTASQLALGVGSASTSALRLGALAQPGMVVISQAPARLVSGYFECKAWEDAVRVGPDDMQVVYEVRGESALQTRLDVGAAYGLTPFVGREAEVALLRERWGYVHEGLGQVVVIRGEAGMGKSRLVQVLKEEVVGETVMALECRCSPYHQHTAFYPLIDLLHRALQASSGMASPADQLERLEGLLAPYDVGVDEAVPLLAALLSLSLPEGRYAPLTLTPQRQRERTLETLVSLLLAQTAASPLLFIVENLHWADASTLDFLCLLLEQVSSEALLVVLTCRPEFEPPWGQRSEVTRVVLNRLTQAQMEAMIVQVASGKRLPEAVMAQVMNKTDGVPLFIEELTRMVVESGQLVEREGHYELREALTQLTIPVSLHDSLMARLDRLGVGKDMAQWASVLGRDFSYEVLEAVTPYDAGVLQAGLDQLMEAGLLFRRGLLPQVRYRFKHALVQEAAYDSLLRRQRQAMHHRIAQVLETQFAELVRTEPEVIARHYTEADLLEQAIPYWQRAGESYAQRSAHKEAINHLQTGLALLDRLPDTPYRAQQKLALLLTLGPVLRATQGQMGRAFSDTYERALALCQQLGDARNLFPVLYGLQRTYLLRPDLQRAREVGEELVIEAERSQEIGLQIVAHLAFGSTLFYIGEFRLAMEHTNQGVTLYDPQRHHNLSVRYGGANPRVSCLIHTARSLVALGYPDQALHHIQTACTQARGLAHAFTLVHVLLFAGILHQARREPQRLQEHAEAVVELSTTQGVAYHLATGKILLGWTLSAQAKTAEGLACVREGLAMLDTREGMLTVPYWLSLQAEVYGHSR